MSPRVNYQSVVFGSPIVRRIRDVLPMHCGHKFHGEMRDMGAIPKRPHAASGENAQSSHTWQPTKTQYEHQSVRSLSSSTRPMSLLMVHRSRALEGTLGSAR